MLYVHAGSDHLLGVHIDVGENGIQQDTLSAVSLDGVELFRYTQLSHPMRPRVPTQGPWPVINLPRATPRSAAGPDGLVYVSERAEYQIVAYRGENEAAWALRVADESRPFTPGDVDRYLTKAREKRPETKATEIEWPDRFPALDASDGQRVFTGTIPDIRWSRAYGDHVYRVGLDPETDEYRVWRHRVVAPFGEQ